MLNSIIRKQKRWLLSNSNKEQGRTGSKAQPFSWVVTRLLTWGVAGMVPGIKLVPPSIPRFYYCCSPHPQQAAVPCFDLKTPMGEEIFLTQICTVFLKLVNVMLKKVPFHLLHPTPGWFGYVACTAVHKQGEPACLQTNPHSFLPSGCFTTKTPERMKEVSLLPVGEQPPASTFQFSLEHPAAGMQGRSSVHRSQPPTISPGRLGGCLWKVSASCATPPSPSLRPAGTGTGTSKHGGGCNFLWINVLLGHNPPSSLSAARGVTVHSNWHFHRL